MRPQARTLPAPRRSHPAAAAQRHARAGSAMRADRCGRARRRRLGRDAPRPARPGRRRRGRARADKRGLLEVEADDLVELDQLRPALEPVRETSMQSARASFGSDSYAASRISRCRKRKRVVVREGRLVGPDQLLAHEPGEVLLHAVAGGSRAPARGPRRWKTWPSTEPRSIRARSSVPSRSRRACSSAWIVDGTRMSPPSRARRASPRRKAGSVRDSTIRCRVASSVSPVELLDQFARTRRPSAA